MKQQQKARTANIVILVTFGVMLVLSIVGLSQTVVKVDEIAMSKEPEVILASAGVEDGADISLPVEYFDQKQDACVNLYDAGAQFTVDARQFEWSSCGYEGGQIEPGLVEYMLGDGYLPVVTEAGKLTSNRGLDMGRWFGSVEGKSKAYSGSLRLKYAKNGAEFWFEEEKFYPLNEVEFSAGDAVNKDGNNHLFTMDFAVPWTVLASGEESLEVAADDDTFVFVGDELVLDMGGVHEVTRGQMAVNEEGEIYTAVAGEDLAYSGVKVTEGAGALVRIFHADRDAGNGSEFALKVMGMSLNVMQTQLAGETGVQVAYDPSDPLYVAPLGESSVFRPDGTKAYMIITIILGVVAVTSAIIAVMAARALAKNK